MAKQRVLFEAGPMLDSKKTGVGYYVENLFNSLQNSHADKLELAGYYFNFLHRNPHKVPEGSQLRFYEIRFIPGKILSLGRRLHFQPYLEVFVRAKSDVVVFTNYVALPLLRKRKIVLVIYDVSFLDVPQFTQSVNLAFMKRFCPPSIWRADTIITISEFTKDRLNHHFPGLKSNIVVTHIPPVENAAAKTELSEKLRNMGIKHKQYILYLGTIEPRKNLQALIAAYGLLSPDLRQQYSLVLAGGKGWKDEAIMQGVAQQKAQNMDIILTGYISEAEKKALYSNASCFVMPSHYEGFGMPILEAMQYSIPTAISDIAVFHEVAGNAAEYFHKDDPQDIARILGLLLTDPQRCEALVRQANQHLKTFSWQQNADKVFEALNNLQIS